MSQWMSIDDELPPWGEPVFIKANKVTQNISYMINGDDSGAVWFEPYFFEHDDELKIPASKVNSWIYPADV